MERIKRILPSSKVLQKVQLSHLLNVLREGAVRGQ